MSSENIKTGLKLSEAIKLLEENEGALVKPETEYAKIHSFDIVEKWVFSTKCLWSVKIPPPKTVTVTRAAVERAYNKTHPIFDNIDYNNSFYQFCKELGL